MKLTKNELNEKRETLCKVLIAINKQKTKVEALKKDLADDFEKNETAYRGGRTLPQAPLGRHRQGKHRHQGVCDLRRPALRAPPPERRGLHVWDAAPPCLEGYDFPLDFRPYTLAHLCAEVPTRSSFFCCGRPLVQFSASF